MLAQRSIRAALVGALLFVVVPTATAQTIYGPVGYRVQSWGYYDSYPYAPLVGSRVMYSPGRPLVTYYDPWRGTVDMPLQPKVLYYSTPLATPEGNYYPRSITVMSDSRVPQPRPEARPPAPRPPAPPAPATFKYDGGPAVPVPDVTPDKLPQRPAELRKPAAPKAPGGPKLGPGPLDLPPGPERKI